MVFQLVSISATLKTLNGLIALILHIFTALHVMQTRYSEENSVHLSVCPSVCPSVCHTRDP